jgi:hypothetical protein
MNYLRGDSTNPAKAFAALPNLQAGNAMCNLNDFPA